MWWALGVIAVLAAVNAVIGWGWAVEHHGGHWFGSDDDSGLGLFDYFSSDAGDWGGDCSTD